MYIHISNHIYILPPRAPWRETPARQVYMYTYTVLVTHRISMHSICIHSISTQQVIHMFTIMTRDTCSSRGQRVRDRASIGSHSISMHSFCIHSISIQQAIHVYDYMTPIVTGSVCAGP